MINRAFWHRRLDDAWREAPIVWLAGVRRSGKTTLARSLGEDRIHFVNCDLPAVEDQVVHPDHFFREIRKPVVVFDEIHQLKDPSRLLKIGADMFPRLKILATGSSSLAAGRKFKDTLTGRKRTVHLTPVLFDELPSFHDAPLAKRLLHGGLPEMLLAPEKSASFYREWMDSFFARDIMNLFPVRSPEKFNTMLEFCLRQSGGLMETTKTSSSLGISRPTVERHLRALEAAQAIVLVRPFHGGGQKEIVKMPKAYAFDTGFVAFTRGWDPLRPDDFGLLWEHLVLDYMRAHLPDLSIRYWRDAAGREVDFVLSRQRDAVDAVECKWNPAHFDATALKKFRTYYPRGRNFIVGPAVREGYLKEQSGLLIEVVGPSGLLAGEGAASARG